MKSFILLLLFLLSGNGLAAVSVHVQDVMGDPISGVDIWLGVQTTIYAKTDISGNASLLPATDENYLFVAKHRDYGRTDPQWINTAAISNLVFICGLAAIVSDRCRTGVNS